MERLLLKGPGDSKNTNLLKYPLKAMVEARNCHEGIQQIKSV